MRRVFTLFFYILLLYGLSACTKDDNTSLEVLTQSVILSDADNKTTINISSNGSWSIAGAPAWCSITPEHGTGDASVQISVWDNTTSGPRSASLSVSTGGSSSSQPSITINVTQEAVRLSVGAPNLAFDSKLTAKTISLTSNCKWAIQERTIPFWCMVQPLSGRGDATITVTPKPLNVAGRRDVSSITIQYGILSLAFKVAQVLDNNPPSVSRLLLPQDAQESVTSIPQFQWQPSTDIDQDKITYDLMLSKGNNSSLQTLVSGLESTVYTPVLALDKSTNNISVEGNGELVKWSNFIGRTGYSVVGMFPGGALYSKGVWRPESRSCMDDNILYDNAPSRESIVRRIKLAAGETFSISDFYATDYIRTSAAAVSSYATRDFVSKFEPLSPPILIENGR